MSPYRVTVIRDKTFESFVLAAMLSINKKTGDRNIYIIQKVCPDLLGKDVPSHKQLAYAQTSRNNSNILDTYRITPTEDHKYLIGRYNSVGERLSYIHDVEYTQSRCLASAMNDYCTRNSYSIISVL